MLFKLLAPGAGAVPPFRPGARLGRGGWPGHRQLLLSLAAVEGEQSGCLEHDASVLINNEVVLLLYQLVRPFTRPYNNHTSRKTQTIL